MQCIGHCNGHYNAIAMLIYRLKNTWVMLGHCNALQCALQRIGNAYFWKNPEKTGRKI
jgi:hypothetical protein